MSKEITEVTCMIVSYKNKDGEFCKAMFTDKKDFNDFRDHITRKNISYSCIRKVSVPDLLERWDKNNMLLNY